MEGFLCDTHWPSPDFQELLSARRFRSTIGCLCNPDDEEISWV